MTADPSIVAALGIVKRWHEHLAAEIVKLGLPKKMADDFIGPLMDGASDAQHLLELQLAGRPARASYEAPYLDDPPEARAFDAMVDWHRKQLPAPVAETIDAIAALYGAKGGAE